MSEIGGCAGCMEKVKSLDSATIALFSGWVAIIDPEGFVSGLCKIHRLQFQVIRPVMESLVRNLEDIPDDKRRDLLKGLERARDLGV